MIGMKPSKRKLSKEPAEKPFWISFSDLMTALMVLFLVAMVVALMAVTPPAPAPPPSIEVIPAAPIEDPIEAPTVLPIEQPIEQPIELPSPELPPLNNEGVERETAIQSCIADVVALTNQSEFKGVTVNGQSIDFGTLVLFGDNKHTFESPTQEQFVRKFVPRVLDLARSKKCDDWLKRVVIEGFASQTGDYLYNLNLSYLRSQRLLCVLLDSKASNALNRTDRMLVQTLFFVGGSSFNTAAGQASIMRRVELKLEFRALGTDKDARPNLPLDPGLKCPNDLR
jgi:outer membrane protein OmpA-like peptidoglycan-associated protein